MKGTFGKALAFLMTIIIVVGCLQIQTPVKAEDTSKITTQAIETKEQTKDMPTKNTEINYLANKMEAKDTQITSSGRNYVEENISLPAFQKNESLLGMICNPEGKCEIYTGILNDQNNSFETFNKYIQNDKAGWTVSEIKRSGIFLSDKEKYPTNFQYTQKGELYAAAVDNSGSTGQTIVKFEKDGTMSTVEIPGLSDLTQGGKLTISSYAMTDQNILIFVLNYNAIYAVDLQTGKVLYSLEDYSPIYISTGTDNFGFIDYHKGKLMEYDINTGRKVNSFDIPINKENMDIFYYQNELIYSKIVIDHDSLYFMGKFGIYQYSKGNINCLVDGYANILSQPSKNRYGYTAFSNDGSFYIIGSSLGQTYQLTHYVLKSEARKYQGEFKIAMYQKNDRVLEAVALYAEEHPDIKVTCQYLSKTSDQELQKQQWEASDVIVSDNGIYSELRQQNLLKDITDTAKALISSEGLYVNIIHSFYEGNQLYCLPAEFSADIYAGNEEMLQSTESILSLANYAKKNKKKVWQGMCYERLGYVLYRAYYQQLTRENGEWNEAGLKQLLKNLKNTSSVDFNNLFFEDSYWYQEDCYQNYYTHNDALLYTSIRQKSELQRLLALLSLKGGKYQGNGTFETNSLVSINKRADDTSTNEFLKLLYGETAQSTRIGNSIPLRSSSLMDWVDSNDGSATKVDDTNWYYGVALSKQDVINFQNILSGINSYASIDEKQSNALQQALDLYMGGGRSLEDTMNRILSNKVYQKSYSSLLVDASKEINILFIGNSLTKTWKVPEQFEKMAKLNGKKVKVNTMVYDGYSLSQHCDIMVGDSKKILQEADYVILQEYGGKTDTTTADVMEIMSMASKNTKFLYYLTDIDVSPYNLIEQKVGQIDNITFIPAGYVHEQLIDEGIYQYKDLHMAKDYHQNALYAFIIAQTMYATLFDLDLSRITYSEFSSYIDSTLKSTTIKGKNAEVEKIQDVIKEVFDMY